MKRVYPLLTVIVSAGILLALWWNYCAGPVSTIILVRHAEKAAAPADDPPLSPAGTTRAQELAHVAANANVTAIFTSTKRRTEQTAAPLEAALGLTHAEFDPNDTAGLADAVKNTSSGKTVLIVGHSNTVPVLIQLLGGPTVDDIADNDFDNLFVLTTRNWRHGTLLKLQYGVPTP